MKMNKMKVMSIIGSLGLTAGVLGGCVEEDEEYVKVVDSEGKTVYVSEDELEDSNVNGMFFIPFAMWNGSNHSSLKSSKGYKGSVHTSKPAPKASSGGLGKGTTSTGG